MSESKEKQQPKERQAPNPPKAKTKSKPMYWLKTIYVKGAGVQQMGDKVTQKVRDAWSKNTKVKIDAYIVKDPPVDGLTDKEKLVAYDALNKE